MLYFTRETYSITGFSKFSEFSLTFALKIFFLFLFTLIILQNYEVKHQEIINQSKLLNKVSKLAQCLLEKSEDETLKDYVPSVEELFNKKIIASQVRICIFFLNIFFALDVID